MARPWWIGALQITLWTSLMSLVMGWMARSRSRTRAGDDGGRLVQPVSTLVMGIVCFAFFAGITIISNTIGKNRTTSIWTTLVFSAFALASVPMILEFVFGRHRVSEQGMEHRGMFGGRREFLWSDVERVSYSTTMKWFSIRLHSGPTVRVSAMVTGLPEFARLVLAHVRGTTFDDSTRDVLRDTQQGRLPVIWQ